MQENESFLFVKFNKTDHPHSFQSGNLFELRLKFYRNIFAMILKEFPAE